MARHDSIEDVAGMVSDGVGVDWRGSLQATSALDEQHLLDNLWVISQVGRLARETDAEKAATSLREDSPSQTTLDSATESLANTTQDLPFEAWGHLRLLERMGAGAFGEVYRAWDTQLHRQVALKLLKKDIGADEAQAQAILQEGRLLARAEHPHVARIYGIDTHEGRLGLWMEFINGTTLEDVLRERRQIDVAQAARIGADLCAAVSAVHGANVIHRDIKPGNVMIETSGRVVLTDFGAGSRRSIEDAKGTRTITGTPLYMAPELFEGAAASPATDVYALGVVLYQMVTGRHPVSGHTTSEVIARHREARRTPLHDLRPDLRADFVRIVEKAIDPDRTERHATMQALQDDLAALVVSLPGAWGSGAADAGEAPAASSGSTSSAPTSSTNARSSDRSRRRGSALRWAIPLAAAALLLVALLGPWRGGSDSGALTARAQFTRLSAGGTSAVSMGDALRAGDQLEVTLELSKEAWVYVLNRDDSGATTVMFPMHGDARQNPLSGGQAHTLPGVIDGQRLGWTFSSTVGRERFLVVASAEPLAGFEDELDRLPAVALGGGLTATPLEPTSLAMLTRGVTGVAAVQNDTPAGGDPGAKLFELARKQGRGGFQNEGVWLYEMSLENRGNR